MTRFTSLLLALFLSSPLYAIPHSSDIDRDNTAIVLSWHAFGGLLSRAWLNNVTGNVTLDPDNEFNDHVRVTIPVSTLIASNSLLTWQLKSDMFFDAQHYPTITFISSRVVPLDSHRFRIFGVLDVRDIRQPVILEAEQREQNGSLILHATTSISRSAFNMTRFAVVVDDRITINIDIQAHQH
ncbi:YceI family protein [Lelliottia sp. RWM.1]|uniref:YceI family protein n=1 Tax=Lelliottia sp. RWM.1 TaxID=2663242 RepID=UPI00193D62D3|nr:YceI family protein [Lelliottia sp. RWM.1]MBM3073317.1 hypothetical protein [Lelliottia sp. RWM.1]